jgi:hypothetical protein
METIAGESPSLGRPAENLSDPGDADVAYRILWNVRARSCVPCDHRDVNPPVSDVYSLIEAGRMSTTLIVGFAIVGAAVVVVRLHQKSSLCDVARIGFYVVKLCEKRLLVRAAKLCRAAPRDPFCAAMVAVLELASSLSGKKPKPDIRAELEEVFDREFTRGLPRLRLGRWIGALGVALLASVVVIPSVMHVALPRWLLYAAGAGVLILGWCDFRTLEYPDKARGESGATLDAVAHAYANGGDALPTATTSGPET